LAGCAEDIPKPLTEEDVRGMLAKVTTPPEVTKPPEVTTLTPTKTRDKDGMKMRLIPAGEFQMGSNDGDNDEKPVHTVYLDDYYIDETEVTNEQYCAFLNDYGKNADAAGHELLDINSSWRLIEKVGDTYKPKSGYEEHPVIAVSWYGAAAYAQWLGARLPTEAEWEKAARGGLVGKKYPWGDGITHDDANYDGTGGKDQWDGTSPVGNFQPNGYGLYDMAGNVWEWCADAYDSSYYSESPKNNPKGSWRIVIFKNNDFTIVTSRRVLRGGSWSNNNTNYLRCADRDFNEPTNTGYYYGFRCSQEP
jgi:formylglycine-generating enzyme required for sulfatase activity